MSGMLLWGFVGYLALCYLVGFGLTLRLMRTGRNRRLLSGRVDPYLVRPLRMPPPSPPAQTAPGGGHESDEPEPFPRIAA